MNAYLEKIAATRLGKEALKTLMTSVKGETSVVKPLLSNKSAVRPASLMDRVKHYARDMNGYG